MSTFSSFCVLRVLNVLPQPHLTWVSTYWGWIPFFIARSSSPGRGPGAIEKGDSLRDACPRKLEKTRSRRGACPLFQWVARAEGRSENHESSIVYASSGGETSPIQRV